MPLDADGFSRPHDMNDKAELLEVLEELRQGMNQQIQASRPGVAMGGHPYPTHLYSRVEMALGFVSAIVKKYAPDGKMLTDAPTPAAEPPVGTQPLHSPPEPKAEKKRADKAAPVG